MQALINLNKLQFGFMRGKGIVDIIFIVSRMQENHQKKDKKLYMCFVDMEKTSDRVPKKSDGVDHEIEGIIKSNGLSSYTLV